MCVLRTYLSLYRGVYTLYSDTIEVYTLLCNMKEVLTILDVYILVDVKLILFTICLQLSTPKVVKMKKLLSKAQSSYNSPFEAMLVRVQEGLLSTCVFFNVQCTCIICECIFHV